MKRSRTSGATSIQPCRGGARWRHCGPKGLDAGTGGAGRGRAPVPNPVGAGALPLFLGREGRLGKRAGEGDEDGRRDERRRKETEETPFVLRTGLGLRMC